MSSDSSTFLKLAVLTGDSFALLLSLEARRRRREVLKNKSKFNLKDYDDTICKRDFRFGKQDIFRLKAALGIPDIMSMKNRGKLNGLEGLCILLRRLAYPNRLCDLQKIFPRRRQELSLIFNEILNFIYYRHRHLLCSIDQYWLRPEHLAAYSDAIHAKGSCLKKCFGFIDGTIHASCRPTKYQRECYSGDKRKHGLKYQSVVIPNGLIANMYGPVPGRRHDSHMLYESKIMEKLQRQQQIDQAPENFYLYGDSGYPIRPLLITPFLGNNLTQDKKDFNRAMSGLRICVEWEFGDLFSQFAFLDFKKNQKIFLQPIAKYVIVPTILKNCSNCLYGSQTSMYFTVAPPSLEAYIQNDPNL